MKRHPHLQPLSDDHHGALVLARRIGLAARLDPERDALTKTWDDLRRRFAREEPHFRVEEERLLPQLESTGEHALVERAWADQLFRRAENVLALATLEAAGRAALEARKAGGTGAKALGARLDRGTS